MTLSNKEPYLTIAMTARSARHGTLPGSHFRARRHTRRANQFIFLCGARRGYNSLARTVARAQRGAGSASPSSESCRRNLHIGTDLGESLRLTGYTLLRRTTASSPSPHLYRSCA